jgi:uncharacterized membrane protein YqgA involved in biofilm formation
LVGTLINTAAVVAGSLAGRAFGTKLSERVVQTLTQSVGIATFALGFLSISHFHNLYVVLGGFLLGAVVGEVLGLDQGLKKLTSLGMLGCSRSATSAGTAFLTSSLLFCVGPLTFLGCLDDGLGLGFKKLAMKSVLDLISSTTLSAGLGWGVILSAGTVLVFQGALTLFAGALKPLLTPAMMADVSATGGLILIALSGNLLGITKIRVASFLPAIIVTGVLAAIVK